MADSHAIIGDDTSVRVPLCLAQLAQRLGLGWAADVLALAFAVHKTEIDDAAPAAIVGPVDAAIARRAPAASMGRTNH